MHHQFIATVGFVGKRPTPVAGERPTSAPALAAEFLSGEGKSQVKASSTLSLAGIEFTVCGWFRPTVATENQIYARYGSSASPDQANWYVSNADNSTITFFVSNGIDFTPLNSNSVTFGTSWHFFCATFNNTSKVLTCSLDNGTAETTTFNDVIPALSSSLVLGSTSEGDTNYDLSCFGLWTRVITGSEITSIYNGGHAKIFTALLTSEKVNLQNYWNLDESSDGSGAVPRVDSKSGTNFVDADHVISTS